MAKFTVPHDTLSPSPPRPRGSHLGTARHPDDIKDHLGTIRHPDDISSPTPSPPRPPKQTRSPSVSPPPPRPPKLIRSGDKWVATRRRQGDKPLWAVPGGVGKPYKPRVRVTVASDGPPSSPQNRNGAPRVWKTKDEFTGKTALVKEILKPAEDIDWSDYGEIMYITGHSNLVSMLDASHLPPKDENGNFLRDAKTKKFILKTWEQKHKTNIPWTSWEHMETTVGTLLKKFPNGVEERLIWHVLFSLLRACLWLHHGRRNEHIPDPRHRIRDTWKPIIHNNINPDSIYVERPWETPEVMYYGSVKLGNFSRNMTLHPGGLREYVNERLWTGPTHEQHADFDAPEFSWLGDNQTSDRPFGGRSDIWSIGAVLLQLMGGLDFSHRTRNLHKWQSKDRSRIPIIKSLQLYEDGRDGFAPEDLPEDYDIGLRTIIASFLQFEPLKRPNAHDALVHTNAHFKKWCEDPDNTRWEKWYETQKRKLLAAERERAELAEKAFRARKQLEKIVRDQMEIVGGPAPRENFFIPGRANNPFAPLIPHVFEGYVRTEEERREVKERKREVKRKIEERIRDAAFGRTGKEGGEGNVPGGRNSALKRVRVDEVEDEEETAAAAAERSSKRARVESDDEES